MTVEVLDKETTGLPDTLTYDQAMTLAATLGKSDFKFPQMTMSFEELVQKQLQLKSQHESRNVK